MCRNSCSVNPVYKILLYPQLPGELDYAFCFPLSEAITSRSLHIYIGKFGCSIASRIILKALIVFVLKFTPLKDTKGESS